MALSVISTSMENTVSCRQGGHSAVQHDRYSAIHEYDYSCAMQSSTTERGELKLLVLDTCREKHRSSAVH